MTAIEIKNRFTKGIHPVDTTTRSEAWTLGDGSVVVLVAGKTGGVHLSHIEVRHG